MVGPVGAFFLTRNLTRRIRRLMTAVGAVAVGDLRARVESRGNDELAELASSVNHMAAARHEADVALRKAHDQLEIRVGERTAELKEVNARLEEELVERGLVDEELRHSAFHDALTGLPNRALLHERLKHCIKRSRRRSDHQYALLFIDLDNFKLVNDSLGHDAGDELLVQAGRRIMSSLRDTDCVARGEGKLTARLGGDEFVVLLDSMRAPQDAVRVCERIQCELGRPFVIRGQEIKMSGSMGIALNDQRYQQAADLIRDADIAMYRAKAAGKARHVVFDETMHASVRARLDLENALRQAIEGGQLTLYYQPIVDLTTARVVAFEALARWNHPERGLISPAEFIPVAEETGLIIPLGEWALEESCRQLMAWNRTRDADAAVAMNVNVSRWQLLDPKFAPRLQELLDRLTVPPEKVHLEITESAIVSAPEKTRAALQCLQRLGVELHLDDFGTGLSSLSCLKDFPLAVLKIDRAFINGSQIGRSYAAIVHAIVSLAHNLELRVVAEGVENHDQLAAVLALECDFAQGFLFSAPVPAAQAETLIDREFILGGELLNAHRSG
jgi:diguanylate cyclase (GGDEF)-like protein